jgi:hypothetical protein
LDPRHGRTLININPRHTTVNNSTMDLETQQSPADAAKPDLSHNLNSGPDTISGSSSSSSSNSGNSTNKDALALVLSPSVTLTLSDNALLLSGAGMSSSVAELIQLRRTARLILSALSI